MMNAVNNIAAALTATGSGKSEGGLIKATVVRGPSGEGVFTLRLSGGQEIGVQVQAEGGGAALEPGRKVLLSPSDGKIFIPVDTAAEQPAPQSQQWAQTQQPAQMRQAAQMLLQQVQGGGDLFVSEKQAADAAAVDGGADEGAADGAKGAPAGQAGLAKIVGFKVVSEGEAHADGIYRADAAGHILDGPTDGESPIKDFAAVRLNTVNGQQVVTVLAGEGLTAALEELRGSFESPLLRALPVDLLKDIFNERGYIDTDTLKALDAVLVNRNLSIDASSQLQMERIGQWLRIALDNPGMAQELVDRIPALGAKDAAGLLELIGRLSSGVAPESFFATENTLLPSAGANTDGVNLLQNLVKAAFSSAPDALLNLVKQIDTSSVALGAQLPPTEAARVVREITSALPAQAAVKPGSLHDAGQLSPRVLEANDSPAPKTPTPASAAPQIRAGYSELTEAAVRALLGGDGKANAAAVGEKINALREAVARMPVASSDHGNDMTAARDGGANNNNRAESNAASANTQSAVSRLSVPVSVPVGGNNVNAVKAPEAFPHVNAQLAVHRASLPSGDFNANVGGGNAKAADAFPAVNRGFVSQQPYVQTNVATSGVNTGGINASGINTNNINANGVNAGGINTNGVNTGGVNANSINAGGINTNNINANGINANSINAGGVGVNTNTNIGANSNIRPNDNLGGVGINTSGINTNSGNTNGINHIDNQNVRGDVGIGIGIGINKPVSVDNSRGVNNSGGVGINTNINSNAKPADNAGNVGINTSGINTTGINTNNINSANNQNIRGGINTNNINPADNQNIRGNAGINNTPGTIDNSRNVNNPGGIGINTAGATSLDVPAIKESCLSIVDALKSSAAPILRELAQRGEISAGGGASLIGLVREAVSSLDDALRPLVRAERPVPPEFYERVAAGAGRQISAEAKNALFSQIGSAQALIRSAVEAVESVNSGVNASTGIKPSVNLGANPGININTNVGASVSRNISVIANVNPGINTVANPNVNIGINPGINSGIYSGNDSGINQGINPGINTNTAPAADRNINPGVNANVNSGINANVNPNINPNVNSGINTNINQSVNPNVNPGINSGVNPTINTDANANPNVNTIVNTNVSTNGNPNVNTNVNANISTNGNPNINTNVNPNISTNGNPNVNTNINAGINVNPNPNANVNATAPITDNRPDDFLQIARRIWANTEKLRAGFREAFSTLDLQSRAAPLDRPADDSTAVVVRRSADSLRTEMLLDVSRALRDVFSSVDELREIVSQLSSGQIALPDAEAALLRAVRALEHQSRQSGAEVMDRLKDILKELNRLQADAARAQEQGSAATTRSSPAEAIRAAALTAARSLENLQLLSTQTRTAETEQHLLALPAKIGGEWTEVQIKFVKERKGEKGEAKDGHVSIYLNVAPSALGQVTAHLDYHPPNLKLAFQFEKPEVTRWFRQRSGELREALSQVGLPGTTLEFHNRRPVNAEPIIPARPSSGIDDGGVEQAEGFEIKNGRVDFKV